MKNKIICGDCLTVLRDIEPESIDLIYLDPPFSSNRDYVGFWQKTQEELAFDDAHWDAGVKGYIRWLKKRIKMCHRVLKPTGSLYLHCDWHANAHIRIMLDCVFGANSFRNEVVWCYSRPSAPNQKQLSRLHDTIFWYTKGSEWIFNPDEIRQPYAKTSLEREGYGGKASKMTKGANVELKKGGKFPEDWIYLAMLKGNSKEYLGYPTQKPELLLERIIKASSNEGDVILDPFCGCGTTIAVASRLNRNFIGIDKYRMAIKVMEHRLKVLRDDLKLTNLEWDIILPETVGDIKEYDWRNFQDWVCDKLGAFKGKRGPDGGIDGTTFHEHTVVYDSVRKQKEVLQDGSLIQSKHWGHSVGEPEIKKFESTVRNCPTKQGVIVAWDFSKNAKIYVLGLEERDQVKIYLVRADDLYKQKSLESPYKKEYNVPKQGKVI